VIVKGVDAEGLTMALNIFHCAAEEEETREATKRVVERVVVEKYILTLVCLMPSRNDGKIWAENLLATEMLLVAAIERRKHYLIYAPQIGLCANRYISASETDTRYERIVPRTYLQPRSSRLAVFPGPCGVDWSFVHLFPL